MMQIRLAITIIVADKENYVLISSLISNVPELYPIIIIAIKNNTDPANVYKKNLKAA